MTTEREIIAHPDIKESVRAALQRLNERASDVFEETELAREDIDHMAQWYVDALAGKNAGHGTSTPPAGVVATARKAARQLAFKVYDRADVEDPYFWRLPVGRAVAYWLGYHEPHAPRQIVQHILDVSRQRVHQMLGEGLLEDSPEGITAESIRLTFHSRLEM